MIFRIDWKEFRITHVTVCGQLTNDKKIYKDCWIEFLF